MNKNLRRVYPTEHQIQAAIVEWANNTPLHVGKVEKRKIGDFLIAIPNGGYREKFEAKRLKQQGVKRGVSDLFLPFPVNIGRNNPFIDPKAGLWIEVKTKKGKSSTYQTKWIEDMKHFRFEACIVKTVDEGIQAIKDYLGMK